MLSTTVKPNLYRSGVRWDKNSVLALLPLIECGATPTCGINCCAEVEWIRVLRYEIDRIAKYLKVPDYILRSRWRHGKDDYRISSPCEFWQEGEGCTIHEARPVVCKYFPLQKVETLEGPVVGIFTEWCDAGEKCIEQLMEWQRK